MIFQESDVITSQMMIMSFLVGMIITIVIIYMSLKMQKNMEKLKLPIVLIIDLTTFKIYNVGLFVKIEHQIDIPVEDQVTKKLWGVKTSSYTVIPSYGHEEDIVIRDRNFQRVVILLCELIGLSKNGPEVHAKWCRDVFPPDIYDVPQKLRNIPDTYIFVRPLGASTWIRGTLRSRIDTTKHMYASMWKIMTKFEQQLTETYSYNDNFLMQLIQRQNEVYLSSWTNVLDVYDCTMRERPVPLYVMARLLHIPQTKLGYSTLNMAISQGGLADASKFASAINNSLQMTAKAMNQTMISTPIWRGMTAKSNQIQSELQNQKEINNQHQMMMLKNLAQQQRRVETASPPSQKPRLSPSNDGRKI